MKILNSRHERGVSLGGLIVTIIVFGSIFLVGARALPSLIEYQAIVRAVNRAAQESSVESARRVFDSQSAVEDIHSISSKDLEFVQTGNGLRASFAYASEIPLVEPVYLLIKYSGHSSN